MTYYVAEVNSINSYRKAEKIEAKNLAAAKRVASKMQAFYDTVLYIGETVNDEGFIVHPVACKSNGRWTAC